MLLAVKQVDIAPPTSSNVSLSTASAQYELFQALRKEVEILKDLPDHPHIVQYIVRKETATTLDLFLEYVPQSLGSVLREKGSFSDAATRPTTLQILDGLESLHARGITHGMRSTLPPASLAYPE